MSGVLYSSVDLRRIRAAMRGTGFFPAGREQAYRVGEPNETGEDERFLTGTAEVSLTAYHIGETLDESELPKKYTARVRISVTIRSVSVERA